MSDMVAFGAYDPRPDLPSKPGEQTWIYKGVRIVIDRELEECIEAEHAADVAKQSAKLHTTSVLERKRAEVIDRGDGQV